MMIALILDGKGSDVKVMPKFPLIDFMKFCLSKHVRKIGKEGVTASASHQSLSTGIARIA